MRAITWSAAACRDVLHMPWKRAARICAAVILYAEKGEGFAQRIPGSHALRLSADRGWALIHVERNGSVVVYRVFSERHRGLLE